jgi:hypothetical protein
MKGVKPTSHRGRFAAFDELINVGRPRVADKGPSSTASVACSIVSSLSNDRLLVTALEQRIADMVGSIYCVAGASGTQAFGIPCPKGCEEVIVPSFTFVGTAHAVQWSGPAPAPLLPGSRDSHGRSRTVAGSSPRRRARSLACKALRVRF